MRKNPFRGRTAALAVLGLTLALLGTAPSAGARGLGPDFARGRIAGGYLKSAVVVGSGFAVARLDAEGRLDTSFGREGVARTGFPGFQEDRSVDASVQFGGTVTVAGYVTERCESSRGRSCGTHPALARFKASGRLDRSFGRHGRVVLGGRPGTARSIVGLSNGQIAVGGRTRSGLPFLAELNDNGSLKGGFGNRGLMILRSIPEAGRIVKGRISRIAAFPGAPGGLLASFDASGSHVPRQGLVRITRSGEIATEFGDGGFLTTLPAGIQFDEYGFGFNVFNGGGVLLAATTKAWSPRRAVAVRLEPDGSPDPRYGVGGVAMGPEYDVRFNVDLVGLLGGRAILGMAGFQGAAPALLGAGGEPEAGFGTGGLAPGIESWGSHASVGLLHQGGFALADANRQLSGLIVARYSSAGELLSTTELSG